MQRISAFLVAILMTGMLSAHALEVESLGSRYADVSPDSPYATAIEYISDLGITKGTGSNQFSPDEGITSRQWAVMLCRAFGLDEELEQCSAKRSFSDICLSEAYQRGWISMEGVTSPDTYMCRGAFYSDAFGAFGVDVYDYELYPDGHVLSDWENVIRIAVDFGICSPDASYSEQVTRAEVAQVIYLLMTNEYQVEVPPLVNAKYITNPSGVNLNSYLRELKKVPENIVSKFEARGWTYSVDFSYIGQYNKAHDVSAVGICSPSNRTIYVSDASSTQHEFGHFLDNILGYPSTRLWKEHEAASVFLREYAMTNEREYYADSFVYFLKNQGNEAGLALMQERAPATYEHFANLAANDWKV